MKNVIHKIMMICIAGMLTTACMVTSGNQKITDEKTTKQIEIGKTTKDELFAMIGEPNNTFFGENDEETCVWNSFDGGYGKEVVAGYALEMLIPFGSMMVGSDSKSDSLTVLFDGNGIVKKIAKGQQTTKTGLFQL